jgi:hypothetical protein
LKKNKPWFDEGCSKLLDQRNKPNCRRNEIHGDNLNNVRCEVSRHLGNKKGESQKDKINGLATNGKNKNIWRPV